MHSHPRPVQQSTCPVLFSVVVDDFGVQYVGRENAQHLADIIAAKYKMTTDWTGNLYVGITLQWDYIHRTVDMSMPGYVAKALQRFNVQAPNCPQHSSYEWVEPTYGQPVQLIPPADITKPLNAAGTTRLQEIIGVLLYYGRAIDNTILVALSSLAAAQTEGTLATTKAAIHLLNYAASHPNAKVRFHDSKMCLHVHSDASYLSESKARSCAGGIFFLSSFPSTAANAPPPKFNGTIHIVSSFLPPLKPKLAHASTTPKTPALFVSPSKK
jgi:hypothetical protein